MKRLYSFFVGIVAIILVLWGISYKLEDNSTQGTIDKLVIYNWGDYIDPELLDEFTAETGIQIIRLLIPMSTCTQRSSRGEQSTI